MPGGTVAHELAHDVHSFSGMDPRETSTLEKALVVAACAPVLLVGLLLLFV